MPINGSHNEHQREVAINKLMKKLTYLGHAGWLFESSNIKCVFDPWSNKSGAFFDSWYPFPDNNNVNFKDCLSNLDFLYISHAHEDHLVKETLELVDRNTLILIAEYKEKTTLQKLLDLGFTNIVELNEEQTYDVKDIKIKILKCEGFLENDSCILIEIDKVKILNLNDCHIDFNKLKKAVQTVDILLLQSSNAIWWPCNYDYNENRKDNFGKIKRENLLKRALKYCEVLKPRLVVPNAGPAIFKNTEMEKWNFKRRESWNPFCTQKDAASFFSQNNFNSDFLMPSESILIKEDIEIKKDINFRQEVYFDLDAYTNQYLKKIKSKEKQIVNFSDVEVERYFDKFKKQICILSKISNIYYKKIDFKILFDFGPGDLWIVDFQNKKETIKNYTNEEYRYHFKIKKNYIPMVMKEKNIDFERLFLSGDFSCKRDPDIFNEFLFTILKNFDTKRFLISEETYAENNKIGEELFILNHKGCKYEVQKYCPHMYADLEEIGYIDDKNNFVCPLHGWKFDISTGGCPGKKQKLKIKRID